MAMSRAEMTYLINQKGGGDWKNIHSITFNTMNPVYLYEYGIGIPGGIPGRGINYVDIDLGNGEFLTGFYIVGMVPPTCRLGDNDLMEAFFPINIIDRVAFKADRNNLPSYATPYPS